MLNKSEYYSENFVLQVIVFEDKTQHLTYRISYMTNFLINFSLAFPVGMAFGYASYNGKL